MIGWEIRIKKKENKETKNLMFTAFCEVWRRGTDVSKKRLTLIFRSEVMRVRFSFVARLKRRDLANQSAGWEIR